MSAQFFGYFGKTRFVVGDKVKVISNRTKYAGKTISIDHIRRGFICDDIIVYEVFDNEEGIYYGFDENELERADVAETAESAANGSGSGFKYQVWKCGLPIVLCDTLAEAEEKKREFSGEFIEWVRKS